MATTFNPDDEYPDVEPGAMDAEQRKTAGLHAYYELIRLTTQMESTAEYAAELAGCTVEELEEVAERARQDELADLAEDEGDEETSA